MDPRVKPAGDRCAWCWRCATLRACAPGEGMQTMFTMPNVDVDGIIEHLKKTGKRTHQLWLNDESLAFVARGREYRSEFHLNPSYEIQYSLKGDLKLHYRTPEGKEEVALVPEGSCLFQPPMVPHSPRFSPDSF